MYIARANHIVSQGALRAKLANQAIKRERAACWRQETKAKELEVREQVLPSARRGPDPWKASKASMRAEFRRRQRRRESKDEGSFS